MPFRVDVRGAGDDALDVLVELGALDADTAADGTLAALMPDTISPEQVARALGVDRVSISTATGHDAGSVWVLRPRPVRVGGLQIVPADGESPPGALRLIDAAAFGTGLHPTTALCLEAIEEAVHAAAPAAVLDIGTGSGVLALGALLMGVPRALGIDIDNEALRVAAENARINGLQERFDVAKGGPESVAGAWPLVVANILPAPLIEMAPAVVRRIGPRSQLVLSGISSSLEDEVGRAYRHLGMRRIDIRSRAGWAAIVLQASW